MHESLWRASLRSLLIAFFAAVGILLALLLLILFFAKVESGEDSIPNDFDVEILPNANGVRKKLSKSSPVILQMDIDGVIGTPELKQSLIRSMLVESRENSLKNDRVKGVLLHINSPGGTLDDADGIYRAIKAYKKRYKVPVIAYVDGICASGGLCIACAADEIYASDVSLVGSVGVITTPFMNVTKLMDKVGVEALTLYAGKGKDNLNPFRPWKEGEDQNLEEIIQYYYGSFVELVAQNRPKVDHDALVNKYGAKIFPAEEAAKIGFIDAVENSKDVVLQKMLGKLGIEDEYYQVVRLQNTHWFNQLFKSESPLITGKMKHELMTEKSSPSRLLVQ
jgi:protease-4